MRAASSNACTPQIQRKPRAHRDRSRLELVADPKDHLTGPAVPLRPRRPQHAQGALSPNRARGAGRRGRVGGAGHKGPSRRAGQECARHSPAPTNPASLRPSASSLRHPGDLAARTAPRPQSPSVPRRRKPNQVTSDREFWWARAWPPAVSAKPTHASSTPAHVGAGAAEKPHPHAPQLSLCNAGLWRAIQGPRAGCAASQRSRTSAPTAKRRA